MSQNQIVAVVDDDAAVLLALSSLVRSLGLTAMTFSSGEAFLSGCELGLITFLISDIHIPGGMTGLDLQEELARRRPGLPVVLMTGLPDETVKERVEESGAVAFMQKPLDDDALVRCLEAYCVTKN